MAAYVRASKDRKGDRWTLETQVKRIKALAVAREWKIVEVYDDNAVSATKKRGKGTGWARMLKDAEAGRFSMVVAVDMDRLLRSTKELNTLIDMGLRTYGLVSARGLQPRWDRSRHGRWRVPSNDARGDRTV